MSALPRYFEILRDSHTCSDLTDYRRTAWAVARYDAAGVSRASLWHVIADMDVNPHRVLSWADWYLTHFGVPSSPQARAWDAYDWSPVNMAGWVCEYVENYGPTDQSRLYVRVAQALYQHPANHRTIDELMFDVGLAISRLISDGRAHLRGEVLIIKQAALLAA